MAQKIFAEQCKTEDTQNSNCFIAVAVFKSDEKIFQSLVDPALGYFYEYTFSTQPFDEKFNLVVKYGFEEAKVQVYQLLEQTALAHG